MTFIEKREEQDEMRQGSRLKLHQAELVKPAGDLRFYSQNNGNTWKNSKHGGNMI